MIRVVKELGRLPEGTCIPLTEADLDGRLEVLFPEYITVQQLAALAITNVPADNDNQRAIIAHEINTIEASGVAVDVTLCGPDNGVYYLELP